MVLCVDSRPNNVTKYGQHMNRHKEGHQNEPQEIIPLQTQSGALVGNGFLHFSSSAFRHILITVLLETNKASVDQIVAGRPPHHPCGG